MSGRNKDDKGNVLHGYVKSYAFALCYAFLRELLHLCILSFPSLNCLHFCFQKLQERQAAFKKLSYDENDQKKWEKILVFEMMSSEESDVSEEEDVIIVKQLSWRSEVVARFFARLDAKVAGGKSQQAKRQMKKRIQGPHSTRTRPCSRSIPSWAFTHEDL